MIGGGEGVYMEGGDKKNWGEHGKKGKKKEREKCLKRGRGKKFMPCGRLVRMV